MGKASAGWTGRRVEGCSFLHKDHKRVSVAIDHRWSQGVECKEASLQSSNRRVRPRLVWRNGTLLASPVVHGVTGHFLSCVWYLRVSLDDTQGWDIRILPNFNASYLPVMPDGSVLLVDNVW